MRAGHAPALTMLFLTGVVVFTGMGSQIGPDRTYRTLLAHAGRDLTGTTEAKLTGPEAQRFDAALLRLGLLQRPEPETFEERIRHRLGLMPTGPGWPGWGQTPAFIDEWPPDAVVLVMMDFWYTIPGNPEIGFHLVRADGRVTSTPEIPTGYRTVSPSVRRVPASSLGLALYEVVASKAIGGLPTRQYYARSGDSFVLIRQELPEERTIVKNEYGAPNWTVGPPAPPRSDHDWLALLDSGEPVKILESLVWLGGVHLDPEAPEPDTWHEDARTARLWYDLVTRGDVKGRLESLAESEEPWISEAARAALDIEVYPSRR